EALAVAPAPGHDEAAIDGARQVEDRPPYDEPGYRVQRAAEAGKRPDRHADEQAQRGEQARRGHIKHGRHDGRHPQDFQEIGAQGFADDRCYRIGRARSEPPVVPSLQGCCATLRKMSKRDSRAESDLRASEILESMTEGFFAVDREWRFTYVNRAAHEILEREPRDLLGKNVWAEYPGLLGTEFERAYRQAMAERKQVRVAAYYPEDERWYEVKVYPQPDGIAIYFRNVTEEKRAEQERSRLIVESERQRRMYEAALSNTPDFVYIFDPQ